MRALAQPLLLLLTCVLVARGQVRVLFIGNSYTYSNQLPDMVEELAAAGGHMLIAEQSTPGGFSLDGHLHHSATLDWIEAENWDLVFLQEQSQMPVIPFWRESFTRPAARGLDSLIREQGAETRFFMTWGREFGGSQCIQDSCSIEFEDYFHMQDSLSWAYRSLAAGLGAEAAPIGDTWAMAKREEPALALWSGDHSHPNLTGSYLAACAIYVSIFEESPVGFLYHGGLDSGLAGWLQEIASRELTVSAAGSRLSRFSLQQVWPNPFNGLCHFRFSLDESMSVSYRILDLTGRLVEDRRLGFLPVGSHVQNWNPGSSLPSGSYFLQLEAGRSTSATRMIYLR